MIDTLKLSKRLQAANMPEAQANAFAEGLSESLREDYVTREYLDSRLSVLGHDIDSRLAKLKEELTFRMFLITVAVVGLANGALFWMLSNLIHSLK